MFALGIPKGFKYERPSSITDAIDLLQENANARPIAGGQSLVPMLKLRVIDVDELVDLNELQELKFIKTGDYIRIGALLTHNEIALNKFLQQNFPSLTKAAWTIADLQVRNRGTIGGSISYADPSGNYFPVLLTLDAEVSIVGKCRRQVKLENFVKEPYTTEINEGEILESIIIPNDQRITNFGVIKRGGSSYPEALVAVSFKLDKDEIISSRIAIGGVFSKPVLFKDELLGNKISDIKKMDLESFSKSIFNSVNLDVLNDIHASKEYRIRLARNLLIETLRGNISIKVPQKDAQIDWRTTQSVKAQDVYSIRLKVNNEEVIGNVEGRTLLLDFLRNNGFTEVKRGCDEGKCGACTVIINGRAIKSCNMLAIQATNKDIRTIKGMYKDDLNYIQKSFLENYAMQCGYCTHGFMMTVYDYLNNIDEDADIEIMKNSIKNICRCTGYINIINAIKSASKEIKSKNFSRDNQFHNV